MPGQPFSLFLPLFSCSHLVFVKCPLNCWPAAGCCFTFQLNSPYWNSLGRSILSGLCCVVLEFSFSPDAGFVWGLLQKVLTFAVVCACLRACVRERRCRLINGAAVCLDKAKYSRALQKDKWADRLVAVAMVTDQVSLKKKEKEKAALPRKFALLHLIIPSSLLLQYWPSPAATF